MNPRPSTPKKADEVLSSKNVPEHFQKPFENYISFCQEMTLMGREAPALPAEVLFSNLEIEVLNAYAKKRPQPIRQYRAAVKLVAKLGGYLDR